jgi:hypothetical protein
VLHFGIPACSLASESRSIHESSLSFSLEAENQDIKTIQDYENTILKWGQEIPNGLAAINRKFQDYVEAKSIAMEAYLESYGHILHNMLYTMEIENFCSFYNF